MNKRSSEFNIIHMSPSLGIVMKHNKKETKMNSRQVQYSLQILHVYIKKFPNNKVYKLYVDHQYTEVHFSNNIARNSV